MRFLENNEFNDRNIQAFFKRYDILNDTYCQNNKRYCLFLYEEFDPKKYETMDNYIYS